MQIDGSDPCGDRLVHGVGRERCRDEDHRGVRTCLVDRAGDGVEHRDPVDILTALPWRDSRHDVRAVRAVAETVEPALGPGEPLHDETRVRVDENRHQAASSTARRAPSSIVASVERFESAASRKDATALLGIRAVEANDDRELEPHLPHCLQDSAGDLVATSDAAEDVEEDRAHLLVARDHLERVDDALCVSAAAEVAEVRRPPTRERDDVDRRHRQSRTVSEHADRAVELHVRDALLACERLERIRGRDVAHLRDVRMSIERVVVDGELRIERPHLALGRDDQRVDLAEHRLR